MLGALAVGLVGCGATTTSRSSSSTTSVPTTAIPVTTATPPPTTTTVSAAAAQPPTAQQIATHVAGTHETKDPGESFLGGSPVTVGDGSGGYLTAVPALRNPSADGHGSLVFFWHNQTFLGWDTDHETWNVTVRMGSTNAIRATYADYAPGDPACCPSLPPVTVTYSWNGSGLAQDRTIPTGGIVGIPVSSG